MTEFDQAQERHMRRCIELAVVAKRQGNIPVGSVVVLDGEIVGEGIEQLPVGDSLTGHAEVLACQQTAEKIGSRSLHGATLYSTAEPCFMCSYVIRQAQIAEVIYALSTPLIGGATSSCPILTDASLSDWKPSVRISEGLLADEVLKLRQK